MPASAIFSGGSPGGPGRSPSSTRIDGRAVAVLARRTDSAARPAPALADLDARLAAHDRREPDLSGYDALIGRRR